MTRARANLLLLLAAAIWGIAFYFQKIAMDHVGPFVFVAARTLLAALCLVPVALLEKRLTDAPWTPRLTAYGVSAGMLFCVAGVLHQAGFITASVTNGGFLTTLYVVFTPLIAFFILRRRPPVHVWPALLLALAGVWLLAGGSLEGFTTGDGYIVISAFFWGALLILAGLAADAGRPLTFTTMQFAVATVIGVPMAFAVEPVSWAAIQGALPSMFFVGVLSSAGTFALFAFAFRYTSPSEGAILLSTETLFAAAAGAILLGERLTPLGWLGASLMFAAMLLVQVGPALSRRWRPKPAA